MKIWIVGLPNVGKSTLFNALTNTYAADAANFPFCTIEPNIGIVDVRDPRVDQLAEMSKTKKTIYAAIKFVDIAWLVKGASKGEGLGNQFLSNIREVDAIVQVVRHFTSSEVVHVEWTTDPLRDVSIINTELIFADIQSIEKKLPDLERRMKTNDPEVKAQKAFYERLQQHLLDGKLLIELMDALNSEELLRTRQLQFLTFKPFLYAINVDEKELINAEAIKDEFAAKLGAPVAIVCATFEAQLIGMDDDEKQLFIEELQGENGSIPTLNDLIRLAFDTVGLMYYFTTGEKETRAWTIKKWATAPQAAGEIHTDFEKNFIRSETVSVTKLLEAGGRWAAKEKWYLRIEWKDYIMQDGDVCNFRIGG